MAPGRMPMPVMAPTPAPAPAPIAPPVTARWPQVLPHAVALNRRGVVRISLMAKGRVKVVMGGAFLAERVAPLRFESLGASFTTTGPASRPARQVRSDGLVRRERRGLGKVSLGTANVLPSRGLGSANTAGIFLPA